ncbi:glutathione S-transferase 1-like [Lolium perenne]|uniref:glutathione S-transferase 1-like n=1 Tax=Lolium perenne TaxID=4522 RepID=UPI0021F67B00|nr:glutathione S-transferase 1-like isoform X1 [Lolium perenne]XP_051228455.1 glutathione S-transferase 1-like isoform X1 [Lolium perenne]
MEINIQGLLPHRHYRAESCSSICPLLYVEHPSGSRTNMSPMKVFGHPMLTNVARVMLFLEEIGAEYELVPVDYLAGEHKRPQHLQLNPFAKMPGFQDGDLVLFESRAIGKYVIRKYGTADLDLLGENSGIEASAMVDLWTEVEAQQYYPAIAPAVFECIINPSIMRTAPTNQTVVDESLERLRGVLGIYEARLEKSKYLAGDSVSFADLNHIPFTFYFMTTPHASLFDEYPKVKAWWESLMARPAVQRVCKHMPTEF